MVAPPKITVAIPAYNRPAEIRDLLATVVSQDYDDFEILVVEDASPRRAEIEQVVLAVSKEHPGRRVRFVSNPQNLGFDGNLRRILELAEGQFTLFMGDDDLLKPGALRRVAQVIDDNPKLGVILRAYEFVAFDTGVQTQVFRYFAEDRRFPAGAETIRTFFRRAVPIAGYTVHTETARAYSTARFDGTLLYQLHVTANVLKERDGYFISDILTSMRKNAEQRHFFGSADSEQGRFAPGSLTPEHSLNFMRGMFEIAKAAEESTGLPIYRDILEDNANYSYNFLRLHAQHRRVFLPYMRELAAMGLGKNKMFWLYSAALLALPVPWIDAAIVALKKVLPATPRFGDLYEGEHVR